MTAFRIIKNPNVIQWKMINGEICVLNSYVRSCSGCTETMDGHNFLGLAVDPKWGCLIGMGCAECNYKGKRMDTHWIPVTMSGRKNCFNCKHLEYFESDLEQGQGSGWMCEKRQAPMRHGQEQRFLEKLDSVEFRLRSKSCFEAR